MDLTEDTTLWNDVLDFTKSAQNEGTEPLQWAIQLSSSLNASGVSLPSVELAHLLVSHICWENNVPVTWKYLEKALNGMLVPPMLVIALLSSRVIPCRSFQPGAYRLYMELLKIYAFSFKSQIDSPNYQKIMKSINEVLHLSEVFGLQVSEPGVYVVEYVFSIVWQLLDATLDDEGLLERTQEKKSKWATRSQDMEIDGNNNFNERLLKANSVMAVEQIGQFLRSKLTSRLLFLAQKNMPTHWMCFIQHVRLLVESSSALRSSKLISPESLLQLLDVHKVLSGESRTSLQKGFCAVLASGSLAYSAGQYHHNNNSAIWLPLDLFFRAQIWSYLQDVEFKNKKNCLSSQNHTNPRTLESVFLYSLNFKAFQTPIYHLLLIHIRFILESKLRKICLASLCACHCNLSLAEMYHYVCCIMK